MTANDIIEEAERILARSRCARLAEVRCAELVAKRKKHGDALRCAGLFIALIAGSLVAVYGIVALVLWLIFR